MKHIQKHIQCAVLGMLVLSGCQSYQEDQSRRSKMAQFALNHPVAAQVIGMEDEGLINMTSNATRFAERTGLDDKRKRRQQGEHRSMPYAKHYGRQRLLLNSTALLPKKQVMRV